MFNIKFIKPQLIKVRSHMKDFRRRGRSLDMHVPRITMNRLVEQNENIYSG